MFPALSLCLSRDFFPCPADVAQLVAHPTCNRAVRGSSPLVGSKVQLSELLMSPQRVGRPAGPHFTPIFHRPPKPAAGGSRSSTTATGGPGVGRLLCLGSLAGDAARLDEGVERGALQAHVLAELDVGDASLGDESADESLAGPEVLPGLTDGQQLVLRGVARGGAQGIRSAHEGERGACSSSIPPVAAATSAWA